MLKESRELKQTNDQDFMCSFWAHNEGNTGKDPFGNGYFVAFHLEVGFENKGRTTSLCDIARAFVVALGLSLITCYSDDVHHRKGWIQVFKSLICQVTLFTSTTGFPFGSFNEESADICASISCLLYRIWIFIIGNIRSQNDIIKWKFVRSGSFLHDCS